MALVVAAAREAAVFDLRARFPLQQISLHPEQASIVLRHANPVRQVSDEGGDVGSEVDTPEANAFACGPSHGLVAVHFVRPLFGPAAADPVSFADVEAIAAACDAAHHDLEAPPVDTIARYVTCVDAGGGVLHLKLERT